MDILSKLTHPIFKDFTLEELNYLLKIAKIAVFKEGEILIHEGDVGRVIYIILDGSVEISRIGATRGERRALVKLGSNSVLGEISVITNNPRSATVTALTETKVLMVDVVKIETDPDAKSLHEKLMRNLTAELSKKLIYANDKLVSYDAGAKYDASQFVDKSMHEPTSILLLFGWKWRDIMLEVPFLAQHGYDAIKIFPPQEFVVRTGNPWWTMYQPVSYFLSQAYGSEEDFIKMIDFCHTFNIKVYADMVLNHMACYDESEKTHVGTNGHTFEKYHYAPLNKDNDSFEYDDFYHFAPGGNLGLSMEDYSGLDRVWYLEHYDLLSLPKLNIDSDRVIVIMRKYAQYLLSLGVDGFRIDAAKHLRIRVLEKVFEGMRTNDGLKPFIYQEYYAGMPLGIETSSYMEKYFKVGYVTAFNYGQILTSALAGDFNNLQKLVEYSFGGSWLHYPENRTVVVLDNHDTERMMPNILNYKHSAKNAYVLAYIFMLAWPFGIPKIMSSFRFNGMDDAVPATPVWRDGRNTLFDHDSPWVGQHRWNAICNMVLFRNKTKNAKGISHIWVNGNQVAFARTYEKPHEYVTTVGYVVINATGSVLKHKFETGLPAGKYYNLITSQLVQGKMQGDTIEVENYGFATIEVKPYDAVVLLLDFMV